MFKIFDKQYYFMLWKIEEKGKTVIETNYNTLREYLENEGARPNQLRASRTIIE